MSWAVVAARPVGRAIPVARDVEDQGIITEVAGAAGKGDDLEQVIVGWEVAEAQRTAAAGDGPREVLGRIETQRGEGRAYEADRAAAADVADADAEPVRAARLEGEVGEAEAGVFGVAEGHSTVGGVVVPGPIAGRGRDQPGAA